MEISSNQVKIQALDGVTPTKASSVVAKEEVSVDAVIIESQQARQEVAESKEPQQEKNVQEAVSQINDYVQNLQRNLQFTVDDVTGKDVVTVIDSESKEVIRQLPSEEALELARRLQENRDEGVPLFSTLV